MRIRAHPSALPCRGIGYPVAHQSEGAPSAGVIRPKPSATRNVAITLAISRRPHDRQSLGFHRTRDRRLSARLPSRHHRLDHRGLPEAHGPSSGAPGSGIHGHPSPAACGPDAGESSTVPRLRRAHPAGRQGLSVCGRDVAPQLIDRQLEAVRTDYPASYVKARALYDDLDIKPDSPPAWLRELCNRIDAGSPPDLPAKRSAR